MKIEEHRRRAEVYRAAAEKHGRLACGMCIAIADAMEDRLAKFVDWNAPETLPFRQELAMEVGNLDVFYDRMKYGSGFGPNPDRALIRGEILTRAAEYHEACVAAGRTL